MRNQPETLHEYNIPRLNWWFLLSGLAFLGCLVLMIWVDYSGGRISWLGLHGDRQWKNYQREFYDIERQRLAGDAQAAELHANEQGLDKLKAERATIEEQLKSKLTEKAAASSEVAQASTAQFMVNREFTMRKADRDQDRSFYEAAMERAEMNADNPEVRALKSKVEQLNATVTQLDLDKQAKDAALAAANAALEKIVGEEEDLTKRIKRMEDNIKLLTKRLNQLTDPMVQAVVNAPIVEFAASNFKVEQIVAETHQVDVNFATVPRVDRCITCHKAIDRKNLTPQELDWRAKHKIGAVEWSKQSEPLRNHPKFDLFVGDTSPHPASKYGCTVCHWGWDRETDFSRAGHTPDDEDQKVAWQKTHHWHEEEFLVQPMRQAKYVQASCLKCHTEQTNLKGGDRLDRGRRLIEQLGCWSCHKMKQMETYSTHVVSAGEDFEGICKFYDVSPDDVRKLNNLPQEVSLSPGKELSIPIRTLRKPGPSLYKVAGKTNKDWVRKWLDNPVAFRPNTYMPRFWGLDNNKGTPDRNATEINAITEFLFAVSAGTPYPAPAVTGNAENGKKLVGQLGCMGCHVVDEKLMEMKPPANLASFVDAWQYRRFRSQGPQLAGTGSKTGVNWIYAWVKNPKQYHPKTKMPDLRLTDQDAADVAEYLASLRNEDTDKEALPEVKTQFLDDETVEYLQVTLPRKQAEEKLGNLDDQIEQYFVDEQTMQYYQAAARMAREEAQLKALQKEYEETFDDAVDRKAKTLAAQLDAVKAAMQAAKRKVAGLDATTKKNVYLGSKLIARYGCFACHEIHGFANTKPIGTELTEWGSKPVNKLDFGLIEIEKDRISWLKQKLHAPRSYDIGRIGITRAPQELLKMGKFNLTDEQIDQIVTVITGMTDEKLTPNEARQLAPAEFHIERGRWMVKELNCQGCHVVEGRGGAIRATGLAQGMEPPMLSGQPSQLRQGQRTQPDWLFEFLKAPQTGEIRPWLKVHMPTFGLSDAEANVLVRYFALEGRTQFPYQSPKVDSSPEHLAAGKQLFDQLQCAKCHIVEGRAKGKLLAEIPEEELADLAPPLNLAHRRLQRDWLINRWLPDPLSQVPGVRMPQFEYGTVAPNVLGGDGLKQREALVDYVLSLGAHDTQANASGEVNGTARNSSQ